MSASARMGLVSCILLWGCDIEPRVTQEGTLRASGPPCGTRSATNVMACIEPERYERDLSFIEGIRTPGSDGWLATQNLCAERLDELGFEVERWSYGTGVNVIGVLPGIFEDELVLISAHYDHVEGCAGADDNATGVAGALEAARALAAGQYERTLVVACWDEEEPNIVGSSAYAERVVTRHKFIAANFVLEMIGYRDFRTGTQIVPAGFELLFPDAVEQIDASGGTADFVAVFADVSSRVPAEAVVARATSDGLPAHLLLVPESVKLDPLLEDLRRSDHAGFWERDLPGMMITDTGPFRNRGYHCLRDGIPDSADRLDTDFAVTIIRATAAAAFESLRVR